MSDDERSKRPTIKTLPDAPKAKAPPEPVQSRTITERGAAATPDSPSPSSNPPASKPKSYPPSKPLAREPGGDETSVERPRGFRAETPTTEPEVRDSMEDMQTHIFDSGKFNRRDVGNVSDTIKDSDNVMPVSGPHAPPEASVSGSMAAAALPAPPLAPRGPRSSGPADHPLGPMPVQPKVTARATEIAQLPQVVAMSRKVDDSGNFRREVATPVKAISMKTPGDVRERVDTPPRAIPQVKLRSMDEVRAERAASPPAHTLGYFAPPRDAAEVRARRRSEVVVWASVCVILACAVALGIWFLAK